MVMAGGEVRNRQLASAVTVFNMRYDFASFYDPLSSLAKIASYYCSLALYSHLL